MNVLKQHLQTTILTLLAAGKSQREIALITRVDRKTIRALAQRSGGGDSNSPRVATGAVVQIPPPRPPARPSPSACEPYRAFITEQLRLRCNYTAIYQDLVNQFGFVAGYNSVKRFAGTVVAKEPEQFDRLEFAPSEEVQVDYGEGDMTRVPGTDRYRRPRLFVMTMRYSRRSFRRVVWESSQQTWARLHEQAWRYFGGSCTYVVLDNLKEGVIKPNLYRTAIDSEQPVVLFEYRPGRGHEHPERFLSGFEGAVMTDGYAAWRMLKGIKHLGCMAHARRYFDEALKAQKKPTGRARVALRFIAKLYHISSVRLKIEQIQLVSVERHF